MRDRRDALDLRSDTTTSSYVGHGPDNAGGAAGNVLGTEAARRLGKEAAVFIPSGTVANTIAIAVAPKQIAAVAKACQRHALRLYVDGARIFTAVDGKWAPGYRFHRVRGTREFLLLQEASWSGRFGPGESRGDHRGSMSRPQSPRG